MVYPGQRYFEKIIRCLMKGKIEGAFLQGLLPIINVFNLQLDHLKFRFIKFCNRKDGQEIIVEINNRYKMYLDLNDRGICEVLTLYKTRESFSTDYIQKIVTDDMIVIDIGANIGYYALMESQLASKGHVYAIEPDPRNFKLLTKNMGLNNCKNVSAYNFAIGSEKNYLDLNIYDCCNYSSFIHTPKGKVLDTVRVQVIPLDMFIESNLTAKPHFIRMDVEGFEYEILRGSTVTLQTVSPLIICIEMHPHLMSKEHTLECIKIMKENNFEIKAIFREVGLSSELKHIGLKNKLQKISHLPEYGYCGNDFITLGQLMANGHGAEVFFEKNIDLPQTNICPVH
jgi:FkbM family methyltransferase